MKRPYKIALLITGLLAGICGFVVLVFWGLGKFIYNQRACDVFNIDNIEIHAEVDIPATDSMDCTYDKTNRIKRARFHLNLDQPKLHRYIQINEFRRIARGTVPDTSGFAPACVPDANHTYFVTGGTYKDERWRTLLDSNTQLLYIRIDFGRP